MNDLSQPVRGAPLHERVLTFRAAASFIVDAAHHAAARYFGELHDATERKRAAGQRIERCVRETDTVARWGGDEFAVVLVDAHGLSAIYRIAQKIRAALGRPHEVHGHEVTVTASIGISVFPDDALRPEELVDKADAAMHEAKRTGRGAIRFFTIRHRNPVSQGAGTHSGRVRLAAVSRRPSSIGETT